MSLEVKIQQLSLELRNLSTYQLECFRNVTESTAMYVHENHIHWKDMVGKYKISWDSLRTLSNMHIDKNTSWIKLTEYLYVEGKLLNPKKVLVDIGGGYYANMTKEDAQEFFERRGTHGLELVEFYQNLFYRKRMVYNAVDQALKDKIEAKLLKIDKATKNKK